MRRRTLLSGLFAIPFFNGLPGGTASASQRRLQDTLVMMPRHELQLWVVEQIRSGRLNKAQLIKALLGAGVSHIEPRPVGFKYHAVLMVDAARRLALAADGPAAWIPLLWNVDYFKHSQRRSLNQSGWTLQPQVGELPDLSRAAQAYTTAMSNGHWEFADPAISRLARSGSLYQAYEAMLLWAIRDFSAIGHKVILLSGVFRCLEYCGWRDSETILRGTAYALLADSRPADSAPRWWQLDYLPNRQLSAQLSGQMFDRAASEQNTLALLQAIRQGTGRSAVELGGEQLQQGGAVQGVWDSVFLAAAETVMNRPTIPVLHCVTVSHGLFSLWQRTANPVLRRLIPLQAISYVARMREQYGGGDPADLVITDFPRQHSSAVLPERLLDQLGDALGYDPSRARQILQRYPVEQYWWPLKQRLNTWLLYKANKAHDFKFGAAVLETVEWLSPSWRTPYLAGCSRLLMGSKMPDSVEGQRLDEWLGVAG